MAMRKETMTRQVVQAVAKDAPGERPLVTIYAVSGPSPFTLAALSLVCLIGAIWMLFVTYYFITVTERAVLFHRMNRFTGRPRRLVLAVPRDQVAALVRDGGRGSVWNHFHFRFSDRPEPTRLNVPRQWRSELDQFMPMVRTPVGPAAGDPS